MRVTDCELVYVAGSSGNYDLDKGELAGVVAGGAIVGAMTGSLIGGLGAVPGPTPTLLQRERVIQEKN